MSITEEEKGLLFNLLEESGYRGYRSGKYFFHGQSTPSVRTAFTRLAFPLSLKGAKLYRLFSDFKEVTGDLISFLQGFEYKPHTGNPEVEVSAQVENSTLYSEILKKDIALFKTARLDGVHDPRSDKSGISLLGFNTVSRVLLNNRNVSIDAILTMKKLTREEAIESDDIPYVWPVFNPYTPELHFKMSDPIFSNKTITALNTAIPPRWMTDASKDIKPQLKGFFKKLVMHLFPDEVDRELTLDWCHYAIYKRNGTVLCLAGARGSGKSTFVEVLGHLVGINYTEVVNQAILEDKFNSQFYNKRLLVFEEVALEDATAINKVKAWCNNKIAIEEKGKDAFSADNFTSMVFLINRLEELSIRAQERRFSIPVVAEENLLTVCSEKEIDDFKKALNEGNQEILDDLAAFGLFLKERKPKFSEHTPIRGENFNRVADLALAEWQTMIREYLKEKGVAGQIVPISVILPLQRASEKDSIRVPHRKDKIDNFLRDYRYLGKYRIGDVVDMTEAEISKFYNLSKERLPPGGRSRRLYGIKPREDFILNCGLNKTDKPEDFL